MNRAPQNKHFLLFFSGAQTASLNLQTEIHQPTEIRRDLDHFAAALPL